MGEVRMKTVVQTKVTAECPSHSLSRIAVRDVGFEIDEPEARGGTNHGPSPTETALAALAGCTNVIGHKCAADLGVDIGHLQIGIVCDFDRRGVTLAEEIDTPFRRIELTVEADGPASAEQLDQVANQVAKFCPLSKLYRKAGTELIETWQPRQS